MHYPTTTDLINHRNQLTLASIQGEIITHPISGSAWLDCLAVYYPEPVVLAKKVVASKGRLTTYWLSLPPAKAR